MTTASSRSPWRFARDNLISINVTSDEIEVCTDGTAERVTVRWSDDQDHVHSLIWTGIARCLLHRKQGRYTETEAQQLAFELRGVQ